MSVSTVADCLLFADAQMCVSTVADCLLFADAQMCPLLKKHATSFFRMRAKGILNSGNQLLERPFTTMGQHIIVKPIQDRCMCNVCEQMQIELTRLEVSVAGWCSLKVDNKATCTEYVLHLLHSHQPR